MALTKSFRVHQKSTQSSSSSSSDNDNGGSVRPSFLLEWSRGASGGRGEETPGAIICESNAIAVLSAVEFNVIRKSYSKVLDAFGCLGILNLSNGDDCCLYLVLVTSCIAIGKIRDVDIYRITGTAFVSLSSGSSDEERLVELRKLLNSGTFYFSWPLSDAVFCLGQCAQRSFGSQSIDNRFFWNRSLHFYFWRYNIDCSDWLLKVICGGVEIRTIYAAQQQAKACLISRYSCERAGTRFNTRGVNDEGHVANFVETEQVIWIEDDVCSFVQTRGSVPLYWEQPGFQVGSRKIKMHRGHEASAPAFDRHFTRQKMCYGSLLVLNLLGRSEGEHMLSQAFQNHHKSSACCQDIPFVSFDYHAESRSAKSLSSLLSSVKKQLDDFGFFFCRGSDVKQSQRGTIRTNCFDCLDRTNLMQSNIGLEVLGQQLDCLGLSNKAQMKARFEEVYRQMWNMNADHVSRIYAGTAALGKSKATDAARSAGRAIQHNFLDSGKQEAIEMLLFGSAVKTEFSRKTTVLLDTPCLPGSHEIMKAMVASASDFSAASNVRVSVGTWNVNGGKFFRSVAFKHELVTDWLLDLPNKTGQQNQGFVESSADFGVPIDIFAIGFQEIVDLNASNIVRASTQNQKEWGVYLQKNLSREHKYIQLTSAQLVGVCLYIFVRPKHAPYIKDMSVVTVKTGLGGATGNKGAIGVRFSFYNTSLCFVCSHFAAGQTNIKERNSQFQDILQKISFPSGWKLLHHDYVFWFGDFNYRIDLTNEEVKDFVHHRNWNSMQSLDQLNVQRQAGNVFQGFCEGPTNFAPTYKYDLFCEDYDTSEKCRVPAWTDRILWRRNCDHGSTISEMTSEDEERNLHAKLLLYNRAELKSSDHRPVMAIFELEILRCDAKQRGAAFRQAIDRLGPPDGTVLVELDEGGEPDFSDDLTEELLRRFEEIGEIIFVRFHGSCMMLTYGSGREALAALALDQSSVNGRQIKVGLRAVDWQRHLEEELNLTASEGRSTPPSDDLHNTLLSDDITIPTVEFSDGDEAEDEDAFTTNEDGKSERSEDGRRRSPPSLFQSNNAPSDELLPARDEDPIYGVVVKGSGPSNKTPPAPSNVAQVEKSSKKGPPRPTNPPTRPPPPPPMRPVAVDAVKPSVRESPVAASPVSSSSLRPLDPCLPTVAATDSSHPGSSEAINRRVSQDSLSSLPDSCGDPSKDSSVVPSLEATDSSSVYSIIPADRLSLRSSPPLRPPPAAPSARPLLTGSTDVSNSTRDLFFPSSASSSDAETAAPLDVPPRKTSRSSESIPSRPIVDAPRVPPARPVGLPVSGSAEPADSKPADPPVLRPVNPPPVSRPVNHPRSRPPDPPRGSRPVDTTASAHPGRPVDRPSRPGLAPPKSSARSGSDEGAQNVPAAARQPLRPQHSSSSSSGGGVRHQKPVPLKMINHIGAPTNVSHTVHATSVEEAQELIRRLMSGDRPSPASSSKGVNLPLTPNPVRRNDPMRPAPIARARSEHNLSAQTSEFKGSHSPGTISDVPPRRTAAPVAASRPRSVVERRSVCPQPVAAPRRESRRKTERPTKDESLASLERSNSTRVTLTPSVTPESQVGHAEMSQAQSKPVVSVAPRIALARSTSVPESKTVPEAKTPTNSASPALE